MVRKLLAVLIVCLAVLGGSPAHAGKQLSVRDEPEVSGPLDLAGKQCDSQMLKANGRPVLKVAFCIYLYAFDPLFEIDLERDYGVVWAQASFDAMKGFCTTALSYYIEVSPGTEIYERTPPQEIKSTKRAPLGVQVNAVAGGAAIERGLVSQQFQLLPGKMTPTGEDGEPRVGVAWSGRTPEKLAFATGAEIGWPWLSSPQLRIGADTIRLTTGPGC
ncbi:MAG: hypothetical protein M3273_06900 [Actinomycetota bacterium]|nr:hypothetical protein [Actinomycetota bacterium]